MESAVLHLCLAEFVIKGGGVIVDIDGGEENEDSLIRFVAIEIPVYA